MGQGLICRALRKIALLSGIPPERRPSPRRSTSFSGCSAPRFRVRPMLSVALSSVMYSVVLTPISLTKQMTPPPPLLALSIESERELSLQIGNFDQSQRCQHIDILVLRNPC
ncbi:hypothetical protein CMEL01_12875 [Colletotrichum melonis]|uniref:Uncharacterized protein n=1 Tax=Colletotrichum melonis TaxID=1209925 RepID=A0AAI9XX93_9PEZI|nr:hypothetical protein CMEL01_12875 [Colletotrichum melonis]